MSVSAFSLNKQHIVYVVGLGLIGRQVDYYLSGFYTAIDSGEKTPGWSDPKPLAKHFESTIKARDAKVVDIVWCAGKAGFSATDEQMEKEFNFYQGFLTLIKTLTVEIRFNFLSSAGGLYENSNRVKHLNDIKPDRPYGFWKLKQEELLATLGFKARIFRIASVFGSKTQNNRAGLINTLIERSIDGQPVIVYGNQNTLRDYISTFDIARYIGQQLNNEDFSTRIVASGRAQSISSLINNIQNISCRKLKVFYLDNGSNSNDILFDHHLIPSDMQITSLEESIRLLYKNSLSY